MTNGPKAVAYIVSILQVPDGSRDAIYRVFEDCEDAASYSSSANGSNSGCVQEDHVSKKIMCITTIMDHVLSESKKVNEGTPALGTYCIFHDGLSQWWE